MSRYMGLLDGAETCELEGSCLLSQLQEAIRSSVGLYKNEGLGTSCESPRCTEQPMEQICKVFRNNSLKRIIQANKNAVSFLDVTLGLIKDTCKPYTKPNNMPFYIHRDSNHPPVILPVIINDIPLVVNKRLIDISSNMEAFERAAPVTNECKTRRLCPSTGIPTINRQAAP